MADNKCDVLIVGGGPAGSAFARQLSRAGLDVLVLDKMDFPRNKPCAGWITPPVIELLQIDTEDYRGHYVWQPITGFRSSILGGPQVEVDYRQPISFGIRRCEFDTFLLNRSGARLRLSERVGRIDRKDGLWSIDDTYTAPMLVGAGGHFCPIARMLGATQRKTLDRLCTGSRVSDSREPKRRHPHSPRSSRVVLLQGSGRLRLVLSQGRFSQHWARTDRRRDLAEHVADFCRFLKLQAKVSCDIPQRFQGHAYQISDRDDVIPFADGVLLTGDSAGLAYPFSGEGIRPAVESGLLAAAVIVDASGDYGRERLAPYGRRLTARFGTHRWHRLVQRLPIEWLARAAASRLFASRWFTRHVVINNWFLRRRQTQLNA